MASIVGFELGLRQSTCQVLTYSAPWHARIGGGSLNKLRYWLEVPGPDRDLPKGGISRTIEFLLHPTLHHGFRWLLRRRICF